MRVEGVGAEAGAGKDAEAGPSAELDDRDVVSGIYHRT